MKITYSAPNASHHYHYASGLSKLGHLYAFISGWPRYAPKKPYLSPGTKLIKKDFFMTLNMLGLGKAGLSNQLYSLLNLDLDRSAYSYAKDSDIFLFYRTTGVLTAEKLKTRDIGTICIVEEVNSHVLSAHETILDEYKRLGFKPSEYLHTYDTRKRLDSYQLSDYILCPSTFAKDSFIAHGFSKDKIIVNHYGMPKRSLHSTKELASYNDEFRILFVGQINIRKGLHYLIEAFKIVKHPKKRLIVVGPATKITGIERTSIPPHVQFTGVLKGADLESVYSTSSVFVLPSIEEGMALVQGEALSYGLPVIATTNTGSQDIFTDGVHGFIVEPCNPKAIADALQKLIDVPSLHEAMRHNAAQLSSSFGSWDKSVNNLASQFTRVLKSAIPGK